MQRADRRGVGAVKAVAAIAPHANQPHLSKHAEVFRDRWLIETDGGHNLAHLPFVNDQIAQDLPPPRFGDGIKYIGGGRGAGHWQGQYIPISEYVKRKTYVNIPLIDTLTRNSDTSLVGHSR